MKTKQSSKTSVTFFLHTRDDEGRKKGVKEQLFDGMEALYEAKRKAEADGTYLAHGANCG